MGGMFSLIAALLAQLRKVIADRSDALHGSCASIEHPVTGKDEREEPESPVAVKNGCATIMAGMIVVAARPVSRYLEHIPRSAARAAMTSLSRVSTFLSRTSGDPNAFPWHLLRPEHASAIRSWAALCHRAGSANAMLTALRGVLRWAERDGLMEAEEHGAVTRGLGRVRRRPTCRVRSMGRRSLENLLIACESDRSAAGARDAALLGLMAAAGLTPAEAVEMEVADFAGEQGLLLIKKGRASRAVQISGTRAELLLARWLRESGRTEGRLFPAFPGWGGVNRSWSRSGIEAMVSRRGRGAGFQHLRPGDVSGGYWWEISRREARAESGCSLVVLEDGAVLLGSTALPLPGDFLEPAETESVRGLGEMN